MLHKKNILFASIGFVTTIILLLPIMDISSFWFDEYFTINIVRKSWDEMFRLTALDVHPPLYYIAVKIIISLIGESEFSLRLVSVLCFGVIVFASILFVAHYYNIKLALVVSVTLISVPQMIYYATEVRMYSMAMMWITLSLFLTRIVIDKFIYNKWNIWWFLLIFVNVAAAYTHYFAGLAAVGMSLFLLVSLLWKNKKEKRMLKHIIKQWFIYCIYMMLGYLPWIFVLFMQMKTIYGNYWISKISLKQLLIEELGIIWNMPVYWLQVILMMLFIYGNILLVKKAKNQIWLLGGLFTTLFWFTFAISYSIWITPILIARYVVILLPILWITVIISLFDDKQKVAYFLVILIMICCFTVKWKERYDELNHDPIDTIMDQMSTFMNSEDVMFHDSVQNLVIGETYFPEKKHYFKKGLDGNEAFHYWPDLTECILIDELSELSELNSDIWYISSNFIPLFEEVGFDIEEISINGSTVYRIYMFE